MAGNVRKTSNPAREARRIFWCFERCLRAQTWRKTLGKQAIRRAKCAYIFGCFGDPKVAGLRKRLGNVLLNGCVFESPAGFDRKPSEPGNSLHEGNSCERECFRTTMFCESGRI